jgi:hypothetical protein
MVKPEDYAKIVEGFRQLGEPNVSKVASAVGFSRDTVRKAWAQGWPAQNLKPIKDLDISRVGPPTMLAEPPIELTPPPTTLVTPEAGGRAEPGPDPSEKADAAPRQEVVATPTVSALIPQPTASKEWLDEGEILRHGRSLVKGAVISLVRLLASYQDEINELAGELKWNRQAGNKESRPASTMKAMMRIVSMGPKVVAMQKALMEAQRLHDGMPQSISETRTGGTVEDEESRRERLGMVMRVAKDVVVVARKPAIDVEARPYAGEESPTAKPLDMGT